MNDQPEVSSAKLTKRSSSTKRIFIWIAGVVGLSVAVLALVGWYIARHAEPILRKRIIETLSARFHSPVELDELHIVAANGFGVTGKGLRILYIMKTNDAGKLRKEPMVTVGSFDFHTNFRGLLRTPTHVGEVHVSDLRLHLPPKEQRAGGMIGPPPAGSKIKTGGVKATATDKESSVEAFVVDRITVDHAMMVLETEKPGKLPMEFDIQRILLREVGRNKPFEFTAQLVNPKPVGNIDSAGHFGPWNADDPRQTPLDGTYTFTGVDMNTIKGIGGHMSAEGNFHGMLSEIISDGETHMKDFSLDVSGHAMPLETKYHATIDGTDGDVQLDPVEAWLGHSYFICRGHIVRATNGVKGHDIYLDVVMPKARIDDMLSLAVKTQPALMRGGLKLHTQLHIPPGDVPVSRKVELHNGTFTITDAVFSSEKIQNKVDMLSMRAQGRPKDANVQSADVVESTMVGKFDVGQSSIHIHDLLYTMPGAQVVAQGEYAMNGSTFDFHGKARTKAKVSEMTTGWKSVLLKPMDPFFSKHNAGTEVPFKISGTKDEPHFGVEFRQDDKAVRDTSNMSAPR